MANLDLGLANQIDRIYEYMSEQFYSISTMRKRNKARFTFHIPFIEIDSMKHSFSLSWNIKFLGLWIDLNVVVVDGIVVGDCLQRKDDLDFQTWAQGAAQMAITARSDWERAWRRKWKEREPKRAQEPAPLERIAWSSCSWAAPSPILSSAPASSFPVSHNFTIEV